ncbi:hypothetical protein FN846DRAFT_896433 [Sphaerosporella brunnea]|uniref:Uncharacterized protein n=1 Tax=Sphaerosporella brunnea TaxID=1250544 RepID=A0A5J5EC35_9PEZI|nr:hypothetical protein FN846DRAFT_896433 [Sphaerosporella brunnea]
MLAHPRGSLDPRTNVPSLRLVPEGGAKPPRTIKRRGSNPIEISRLGMQPGSLPGSLSITRNRDCVELEKALKKLSIKKAATQVEEDAYDSIKARDAVLDERVRAAVQSALAKQSESFDTFTVEGEPTNSRSREWPEKTTRSRKRKTGEQIGGGGKPQSKDAGKKRPAQGQKGGISKKPKKTGGKKSSGPTGRSAAAQSLRNF